MKALDCRMLADANQRLAHADVPTILRWARETFGDDLSMTTAFGYSGIALLHHVLKIMPDIKLYFIDTGFHFPETLEFCDRLKDLWNLHLEIVRPRIGREELVAAVGSEPYKANPDLCCVYCKTEPLLRFIHKHTAWLSGLRRDQSTARSEIEVVEVDGRGVVKVCPMAHWTREQTWAYIRANRLPYHPLHDKGYPSIGCAPCTVPNVDGENERDGRWPFMQKLECGIHLRAA
jgi:phosphoadenosine phosphosulfate reductase